MTESEESSARFDFSEDDLRLPSEGDERNKQLSKKEKSTLIQKMFGLRGKKHDYEEVEDLLKLQGIGIRRYEYMELHTATQGFSEACKIGEEGSYAMYRGTLREEEGERAVVIKLLSKTDHHEAISSYTTQVRVLSLMRHRNVIKLSGCFHETGRLALVFEFMPNGNLFDHLSGKQDLPPLTWKVRYSTITKGIVSALQYLHDGLEHCVIHRDINPSNIWLDPNFNPKLAAFELSIIAKCDRTETIDDTLVDVVGTSGYIDPRYLSREQFSRASDIYSFGVVAMQIASGREAYDREGKHLGEWVEELYKEGRLLEAVDPKLGDDFEEREVERLLLVGLRCTQLDPKSRPSAKMLSQLLSNVGKTRTGHETHSSPDRTLEEPKLLHPGADVDATTASMNSKTETHTFEDTEAGDRLLDFDQDNYREDEPAPALSHELVMFDIGIPPEVSISMIENNRNDHHRNILKGFINYLHEMMKSEESLPRFEDALEKIKICTTALIVTVGPPLNDWNTLAQLVLRCLKEREGFFKFCDDHALVIGNATMLSLKEGMLECSRTIKEDKGKLRDFKELRAHAQQECTSLEAQLAEAQGILFSVEEDIKVTEERIIKNLSSLQQRRRHYDISKQYEYVLSELSSFTC